MTFLAPLAFVALVVPVVIYVIHWLFGSRRRVRVPAVFLWANLPQASTGRSRRRWPPLTLLLLLQLAAATVAVLALTRPATSTDPPRHLALVLDASATMQATDVSPTRFEAARARATERLAAARISDTVSLIRAGREATLLASGSPDHVRAALASAQPGNVRPAIREALALASSQLSWTPERRGHIVLVTDVAFQMSDPMGPLATPVEVVAVGGGSDNQAIVNANVRMDPTGRAQTAFVEIANHAEFSVRIPVRLTADGAPLDERQVEIAARSRVPLSFPLPIDAHLVSVRLLGRDSLALDDRVDIVAPGGPRRNVLVVGAASDAVRRALESIPTLRILSTEAAPIDLTVLQATLPTQLPAGPLLVVNPPATSARLLGVGLGSGGRVQSSHPLLQGLDLSALQGEIPNISGVPGWARIVLGTAQGPLIMEGKLEGRPVVALTFDPAISGLEKSLAFPLLISNATSYLLSQTDPPSNAALATEPFDPLASDIAPQPIPSFASVSQQTRSVAEGTPSEDHSRWLVAAALVLLGGEWLVFARRG